MHRSAETGMHMPRTLGARQAQPERGGSGNQCACVCIVRACGKRGGGCQERRFVAVHCVEVKKRQRFLPQGGVGKAKCGSRAEAFEVFA